MVAELGAAEPPALRPKPRSDMLIGRWQVTPAVRPRSYK